MNTNYNYSNPNLQFGMKKDSKTAKRILAHVSDEVTRNKIHQGIDEFCDITQKKGIKGPVVLFNVKDSRDSITLKYSITPTKTNEPKDCAITVLKEEAQATQAAEKRKLSTNKNPKGETKPSLAESVKSAMLKQIDYLFSDKS